MRDDELFGSGKMSAGEVDRTITLAVAFVLLTAGGYMIWGLGGCLMGAGIGLAAMAR